MCPDYNKPIRDKLDDTPSEAKICRIHMGSYTGDGATSLVIPVPFNPLYVRIWLYAGATASQPVYECGLNFTAAVSSLDLDGDTDLVANAIIALGTLGFTVDDAGSDSHPNKLSQTYVYMALG